jgi:hypothetical protein
LRAPRPTAIRRIATASAGSGRKKGDLADLPVLVEADVLDHLQLPPIHARCSDEHRPVAAVELVGVAQVLEHIDHDLRHRPDLLASVEREPARERRAQHSVRGERVHGGLEVPTFHCHTQVELGGFLYRHGDSFDRRLTNLMQK